jgi:hypothetical protein
MVGYPMLTIAVDKKQFCLTGRYLIKLIKKKNIITVTSHKSTTHLWIVSHPRTTDHINLLHFNN